MNCKQFQDAILESLAAEAGSLGQAARDHRDSCAACREFHHAQRELLRSLDAGLKSLVNPPVPPSLLPGVRARMDERSVRRGLWTPAWGFAVTVAVALLLFGISYRFHRAASPPSIPENSPAASQSASALEAAAPPVEKRAEILPGHRASHARAAAPSMAAPEVIVLAEEREAFARFVAEVPGNREAALALTRPAPAAADEPRDIALLQVNKLQVKPLEETESD